MIYATKFMVKVREDNLARTMASMEDSILPRFGEVGFAKPFVVARRRPMEKLDREKAGAAVSALRERLAENAPPDDPSYAGDLKSLEFGLVRGVTGYAHGMIHHHKKNKRPEEYEMLRREMRAGENRERVAGIQLDCYASHSSDASVGADDLDPTGTKTNLPFMLRTMSEELKGLLFLKPEAIKYMVFQKSPFGEGRHALQTFVSVPSGKRGDDPRDVKARIRTLIENLTERSGSEGLLALKSLAEGAGKGSRWHPNGTSQHRGDEPDLDEGSGARSVKGYPDVYELVTLWKSENQRDAARAWLEEALPSATGHIEEGYGGFASSPGELALRA